MIGYTHYKDTSVDGFLNVCVGFSARGKSHQLNVAFENHDGGAWRTSLSEDDYEPRKNLPELSEFMQMCMAHVLPRGAKVDRFSLTWGRSATKLYSALSVIQRANDYADGERELNGDINESGIKYAIFIDNVDGLCPIAVDLLMTEIENLRYHEEWVQVYLATNDLYLINKLDINDVVVCHTVEHEDSPTDESMYQVYRAAAVPEIVAWNENFEIGRLLTMSQLARDIPDGK